MIKTVGKKFGRAFHFDFHTSPGVKGILKNFDADKFARQLENAHVEHVNVAARCNMGFSYYNTKLGVKYPGLGERDILGEMIDACHKRDIAVIAYLNVALDHEVAADKINWLVMDKDGAVYRHDKKSNFFRSMCYNSPYREHYLNEIREVSQYDIDGIFSDCFMVNRCYCPYCIADMKKKGVDIDDENAVYNYQIGVRSEFVEEIRAATGDKRDKIKMFFNGLSWGSRSQTHAEIECLSNDPNWGYDFFEPLAAYARTMYEDRVFMSGRFQNSWGDLGGIKTVTSMQHDLYLSMMNSFGISYGDHLHPVDGFENEVVKRVKAVMEERIPYEPYIDNSENLVEVGIIMHSQPAFHRLPVFTSGAVRLMKELKLQYNLYDEKSDFDNGDVKLLLITENDFDSSFEERLCKFVKNGGKIIFFGEACELGARAGLLDYVDYVGKDENDNAYFTLDGSDMRWAIYKPSVILKNKSGTEKSKYVSNIVNFIWDGRQSYYYRAQGEPTEYSVAVHSDKTAAVCFNLPESYIENFLVEQRTLFSLLVDALLDEKLVASSAMPKTATVSLTKNDKATVLHVKSTYPEHKMNRGIIEDHVYMKSVPVSVKGEYEVYTLPHLEKIESRCENGRTVFNTGDILGYQAYLLK